MGNICIDTPEDGELVHFEIPDMQEIAIDRAARLESLKPPKKYDPCPEINKKYLPTFPKVQLTCPKEILPLATRNSDANILINVSDDVLSEIFSWLETENIFKLAFVCKRFERCSNVDWLWRMQFGRHFKYLKEFQNIAHEKKNFSVCRNDFTNLWKKMIMKYHIRLMLQYVYTHIILRYLSDAKKRETERGQYVERLEKLNTMKILLIKSTTITNLREDFQDDVIHRYGVFKFIKKLFDTIMSSDESSFWAANHIGRVITGGFNEDIMKENPVFNPIIATFLRLKVESVLEKFGSDDKKLFEELGGFFRILNDVDRNFDFLKKLIDHPEYFKMIMCNSKLIQCVLRCYGEEIKSREEVLINNEVPPEDWSSAVIEYVNENNKIRDIVFVKLPEMILSDDQYLFSLFSSYDEVFSVLNEFESFAITLIEVYSHETTRKIGCGILGKLLFKYDECGEVVREFFGCDLFKILKTHEYVKQNRILGMRMNEIIRYSFENHVVFKNLLRFCLAELENKSLCVEFSKLFKSLGKPLEKIFWRNFEQLYSDNEPVTWNIVKKIIIAKNFGEEECGYFLERVDTELLHDFGKSVSLEESHRFLKILEIEMKNGLKGTNLEKEKNDFFV